MYVCIFVYGVSFSLSLYGQESALDVLELKLPTDIGSGIFEDARNISASYLKTWQHSDENNFNSEDTPQHTR